jgi:hypothetical protein
MKLMDVDHLIEEVFLLWFKLLKIQKLQLYAYAMTDKTENCNLLLIIALKLNFKLHKVKALKKEFKW